MTDCERLLLSIQSFTLLQPWIRNWAQDSWSDRENLSLWPPTRVTFKAFHTHTLALTQGFLYAVGGKQLTPRWNVEPKSGKLIGMQCRFWVCLCVWDTVQGLSVTVCNGEGQRSCGYDWLCVCIFAFKVIVEDIGKYLLYLWEQNENACTWVSRLLNRFSNIKTLYVCVYIYIYIYIYLSIYL